MMEMFAAPPEWAKGPFFEAMNLDFVIDPTNNVYCKTGQGGGVNPTCSPKTSGGSGGEQLASREQIQGMKPKALKALADEVGFSYGKRSPEAIRTRLLFMEETKTLVGKGTTVGSQGKVEQPSGAVKTTAEHAETVLRVFKDVGKDNSASIADIQAKSGIPLEQVHAAINDLRRKGILSTSQLEGENERLRQAVIKEGDSLLAHVHLRTNNESELIDNVFCRTGPGGGIDPTCGTKTGGGGGAGLSKEQIAEATKESYKYVAASPKAKMEILKEAGYPVEAGKFPGQVEFRQHVLNKMSAGKPVEAGMVGGMVAINPKHEEARQQVVALGKKLQGIDARRREIDTLRAGMKDGPEKDKLGVERYQLKKQEEAVASEAHAVIKSALGGNGQKVDKNQLPDPDKTPGTELNTSTEKSRQFLDGLLHNGEVSPVRTERVYGARPGYEWENNKILTPGGTPSTEVTHEYGHHIERRVPGALEAAQAFHAERTKGEAPTKLSEKFPDARYKERELGYKDNFEKTFGDERRAYYAGKKYETGATEIISMGLEQLHANPVKMAKDDPQYFHFMMQTLGGDNRRGGRDEGPTANVFCPTGPGGGINPSCGAKSGGPKTGSGTGGDEGSRSVGSGELSGPAAKMANTTSKEYRDAVARLEKTRAEYSTASDRAWANPDRKEGFKQLAENLEKLNHAKQAVIDEGRKDFTAIFISGKPNSITYDYVSGVRYRSEDKAKHQDAMDFLSNVAHTDMGKIPPVRIDRTKDGREYEHLGTVHLQRNTPVEVIVHEVGHVLEKMPGVAEKVKEFSERRFGTEQPTSLNDRFPKQGYETHEKGRKNDMTRFFPEHEAYYVGKTYPGGQSEVVSMGLQALHRDPKGFAEKDPEYFNLVMGILQPNGPGR